MSTEISQYEGIENLFLELINGAYDIASGGMAVHTKAVESLLKKDLAAQMPQLLIDSLLTSGSNYFIRPWILRHEKNDPFLRLLLEQVFNLYRQLHWRIIRYVLGGEEDPLPVPLSDDQLRRYVDNARQKGLIYIPKENIQAIEISETANPLLALYEKLAQAGGTTSTEFPRLYNEAAFSEKIRQTLVRAALLKLALMIYVTAKIVEIAFQEKTIPRNYKPPSEELHSRWQQTFGTPLPTIEELYTQAYQVFTSCSPSDDKTFTDLLHSLPPPDELPWGPPKEDGKMSKT